MFYETNGSSRSMPDGQRIRPWERERRWTLRVVVLGVAIGCLMTTGVLGSQRDTNSWVTVAPGQSLWAIAVRHYPQTDPRQAVWDIQAANHLGGDYIYPGERLVLPPE